MKDDEGFEGVKLSRDLVKVAGQAMTANLSTLGPMVLPVSEKAKYLWRHFERKVGCCCGTQMAAVALLAVSGACMPALPPQGTSL